MIIRRNQPTKKEKIKIKIKKETKKIINQKYQLNLSKNNNIISNKSKIFCNSDNEK